MPDPALRSLREAFGSAACVPEGLETLTDDGPQYTGADCEELCKTWRLESAFAPAGLPERNAVADRFIRTLEAELIWTRDWASVEKRAENRGIAFEQPARGHDQQRIPG